MGHANVVRFAGLRIAGLSGIFNKHHYDTGKTLRCSKNRCDLPRGVINYMDIGSVLLFIL